MSEHGGAFPPPGYAATGSAVSGIEVYRPALETEEASQEVVAFKCPRCLGTTAYSVEDGGLRCSYCGYYEPPAQQVVGKGAREFEFTVETVQASRQASGWGVPRKDVRCQSCGATVSVPVERMTHICLFCGSNQIIQMEASQDTLRPRFLIPFQVDEAACRRAVRTWLGSSWMTPSALQNLAGSAELLGLYLPYWTFDAGTTASWRAQVGHTVHERYYDASSKSWKTRTKTVWRWESGRVARTFDDLLVPGAHRISALLLERIGDFQTSALTPYEPTYLAGFTAQTYDVTLDDAWTAVRKRMRERTRQACREQASTSRIRNFTMSLDFRDESWRYVLAPVYLASYRYQGERYQVLVNGQTGAVAGQRPVAWPKVWLAVTAMVAPGLLLGAVGLIASALGLALPPALVAGGGILVLALVLLVIGGIFAVLTLVKASRMDDV
jgi:predicted RNA-binding Zn-ribbon protein involved in translation (DUF1610 family)